MPRAEKLPPIGPQLEKAFNLSEYSMSQLKTEFRKIAEKHLDLYVVIGEQIGSFDKIIEELKASFSQFDDEVQGESRLQLTVSYIKGYFKNKISVNRKKLNSENTKEKSKPTLLESKDDSDSINSPAPKPHPAHGHTTSSTSKLAQGKSKFKLVRSSDDVQPESTNPPAPAFRAARGYTLSSKLGQEKSKSILFQSNDKAQPNSTQPYAARNHTRTSPSLKPRTSAVHDAPYIKAFLESFTPSLLYLLPTLVHARIYDKERLDAVAKWPRESLRRFLNPPAPEPHAPPSYTASSSSSKPQPAPQLPAGHDAPYIKAFLESFTPSLLYTLPTLVHARIYDKERLDAVAKWPRESLRRFLSTLPDPVLVSDLDSVRTGEGEGKGRLRKVVVEALVLRLTFDESEY
ncbi:hypothetical protein K438DRAFT_1981006 [Mycena galopus ATCC 62051]|nr:hypothetical protein K438DRAFT_1981006 [Mycena galopus ATCC 62051]